MTFDLPRRLAAEALGTGMLVATVVGSGIMAQRMTDDIALALLGNTWPTGAILVVLITILGPVSGAHFNPAVTLVFALRREIEANAALTYIVVQIAGGVAGPLLAHAVFESSPSWRAFASGRTPFHGWSGYTSPPRTGSRPRLLSRILRSRSRAHSLTPFPVSAR